MGFFLTISHVLGTTSAAPPTATRRSFRRTRPASRMTTPRTTTPARRTVLLTTRSGALLAPPSATSTVSGSRTAALSTPPTSATGRNHRPPRRWFQPSRSRNRAGSTISRAHLPVMRRLCIRTRMDSPRTTRSMPRMVTNHPRRTVSTMCPQVAAKARSSATWWMVRP